MGDPAKDSKRTLHLPRILCLHGGGTNAAIFRMQSHALEKKLLPYFRLVYAEAPFVSTTTKDVELVYGECAPFKSWFRIWSSDPEYPATERIDKIDKQITQAMADDDAKGATGEWVALLGFSQGARLSASLLYAQQTVLDNSEGGTPAGPKWRFAVLIAGPPPLVWLNADSAIPEGLVDAAYLATPTERVAVSAGFESHLIKIPTIHIHGLLDPHLEWHRQLYSTCCRPNTATLLEWDGAHRMPIKPKDVDAVVKAVITMAWKTGVPGVLESDDMPGM